MTNLPSAEVKQEITKSLENIKQLALHNFAADQDPLILAIEQAITHITSIPEEK